MAGRLTIKLWCGECLGLPSSLTKENFGTCKQRKAATGLRGWIVLPTHTWPCNYSICSTAGVARPKCVALEQKGKELKEACILSHHGLDHRSSQLSNSHKQVT